MLPRIGAGATGAIVLVAATVSLASLIEMPQYEASSRFQVDPKRPLESSTVRVVERPLERKQRLVRTTVEIMQSRSVAEEVIKRQNLDTTPQAFLKKLTVDRVDGPYPIELSYKSPSMLKARGVVDAVIDVSSMRLYEVGAADGMGWTNQGALEPLEASVSPNSLRNGLLALVSGLLVCMGLAFALPRVAASGIGRAALRATRAVGRIAIGSPGLPATPSPATQGAKEKELLEALARRGKLTVAGVALETSLTVEEANRMLSGLVAKWHLEVSVEHGRLLYSLWEEDAPRDGPL